MVVTTASRRIATTHAMFVSLWLVSASHTVNSRSLRPDVKQLKFPIDPEPGPRYRGPGSADLTLHLGQSRFRRCTLALPALAVAGLRSHRREACTSGSCCTARLHRSTVYPACSPVLCTRSCSSPCGWFVNTQL